MAEVASPYGLRLVNTIGGRPYNAATREFKLSTNNAAAIHTGDVIQLTSAGNPQAITTTPVAQTLDTASIPATAGIVGVCAGVRYVNPSTKQSMHGMHLPANAITAGYSEVYVFVVDDPDAVFKVQGSAAFGSLTNGAHGAIGKNAALGNFSSGNAITGNSGINLVVGADGSSLAATTTLAMRIVDIDPATANDPYPDLFVKFNVGVHSYQNALGV